MVLERLSNRWVCFHRLGRLEASFAGNEAPLAGVNAWKMWVLSRKNGNSKQSRGPDLWTCVLGASDLPI